MKFTLVLVVFLTAAAICNVQSRVVSEEIDTKSDTAFIERFVFAPGASSVMEYTVTFDMMLNKEPTPTPSSTTTDIGPTPTAAAVETDRGSNSTVEPAQLFGDGPAQFQSGLDLTPEKKGYSHYYLAVYDDSSGQWPYVRANEDKLTCRERQKVATDGGMVVTSLSPDSNPGLCYEIEENGKTMVQCKGTRSWSGYSKARWWFATLQNCGTHKVEGIKARIEFKFTNGAGREGFWQLLRHFSADKTWLLPTNIASLIAVIGIFMVAFVIRKILIKIKKLHMTFRLYFASVVIQAVALMCLVASQVAYGRDGIDDIPNLKTIGRVLSWIASLIFLFDVILVAKGYSITRGKISTSGCIKLTIYMMLYCSAYVAIYLYVEVLTDPRDVLYLYDCPAGYLLVSLRVLGVFWLIYASAFTVKHNPSKRVFYSWYTLLFGAWFAAEPIMIGITNLGVQAHNRAQIVNAGYWVITLMGYGVWLKLFWPSNANKMFPYTKQCNEVGFIEGDDDDDDNDDYDYPNTNTEAKYQVADEFTGVCIELPNVPSRPGAPVTPQVNNFFPETMSMHERYPDAANGTAEDMIPHERKPRKKHSVDFGMFAATCAGELQEQKKAAKASCSSSGSDITVVAAVPANLKPARVYKHDTPPTTIGYIETDWSIFQVGKNPEPKASGESEQQASSPPKEAVRPKIARAILPEYRSAQPASEPKLHMTDYSIFQVTGETEVFTKVANKPKKTRQADTVVTPLDDDKLSYADKPKTTRNVDTEVTPLDDDKLSCADKPKTTRDADAEKHTSASDDVSIDMEDF